MMLRNTVSTMTSECFLVRSATRETSSTTAALVMLPLLPLFPPHDRGPFAAHRALLSRASPYVMAVLDVIAEHDLG